MRTKIWYFHKNPDKAEKKGHPLELPISTETFALTREKVGEKNSYGYFRFSKKGVEECENPKGCIRINFKDYTTDKGSFREFRDNDEVNYFLEDIKYSLENKLFGPCWEDFVKSLSNKKTASNMTIITARGHSPRAMYEGMKYLKEHGYIKYLPLMRHIFPVSHINRQGKALASSKNPSEAKLNIIIKSLDTFQAEAEEENKTLSFGFSDDDEKTIKSIKKELVALEKKGRWPNLKIRLYFTGNKKKEKIVI